MNLTVFRSLPLKKYIISYSISFILTVILLSLVGVLFSFFPPSDFLFEFICKYSGTFSAFISAILCAYRCGKHGIVTGLISADAYTVILFFAGCMIFGVSYHAASLFRALFLSSIGGMIGGIIGVNCK